MSITGDTRSKQNVRHNCVKYLCEPASRAEDNLTKGAYVNSYLTQFVLCKNIIKSFDHSGSLHDLNTTSDTQQRLMFFQCAIIHLTKKKPKRKSHLAIQSVLLPEAHSAKLWCF